MTSPADKQIHADDLASRHIKIIPDLLWRTHMDALPVMGVSLHSGHDIRPELIPYLAIDEQTRIREEDPFTDYWAEACGSHIIARRSRFEVDLNRPLEEAICVQPADCWNLRIWKEPIPEHMRERSLAEHGAFYRMVDETMDVFLRRHDKVVVYDVHSYNHRRDGPDGPPADPAANPDVNIGTGSMERAYWAPVVEAFAEGLSQHRLAERPLDIRENVNFRGRHLAQYLHDRYPWRVCVLAIEVKKFFMHEWTGVTDLDQITEFRKTLENTLPAVTESLEQV